MSVTAVSPDPLSGGLVTQPLHSQPTGIFLSAVLFSFTYFYFIYTINNIVLKNIKGKGWQWVQSGTGGSLLLVGDPNIP